MKKMLYEGKAKQIFQAPNDSEVLVYFKDDATAFNGEKKGIIKDKGILNNLITSYLFEFLNKEKIETHFIKRINEREMLVKKLNIIPIEVVVRNIAAGSLAKRLGWKEGKVLPHPAIEFYYKNDELGDPLINGSHVSILKLATLQELEQLELLGFKINDVLNTLFKSKGLLLVDFKLEFGRFEDQILLGDEISPDTCRLWDIETLEKLDKDRFRRDLGQVEEAYEEIWNRLKGENEYV